MNCESHQQPTLQKGLLIPTPIFWVREHSYPEPYQGSRVRDVEDGSYPLLKFFFFFNFIYLFIFGCVGSLLLCAGFLSLLRAGDTLPCGARASHCGGFSCCGARALGVWASVVVACGLSSCGSRALERRLSSCGARA